MSASLVSFAKIEGYGHSAWQSLQVDCEAAMLGATQKHSYLTAPGDSMYEQAKGTAESIRRTIAAAGGC